MRRFRKILNWVFAFILILMLITVIGIEENSTYTKDVFNEDLSEGWMLSQADGTRSEISFPYDYPDENPHVEMVRTLPRRRCVSFGLFPCYADLRGCLARHMVCALGEKGRNSGGKLSSASLDQLVHSLCGYMVFYGSLCLGNFHRILCRMGTLNYLALSLMPLSLLGVLNSICSEKLASLKSRRAAPAGPPGGRTWFQSAGSWWCSGPRAG